MALETHHKYRIALSLVEKVGSIRTRQLVAYCGSAEAVFESSKKALLKIPGISNGLADHIKNPEVIDKAERELDFLSKNDIRLLYFLEDDYPARLKQYEDSPACLYYKGNADLNAEFHVAIVGTRTPSERGKWMCEKIIEDFKELNISVFSGLAYGVDAEAHKACLKNGLPTIGIVAHGLDSVYPSIHKKLAMEMMEQGGLLTEFPSGVTPERERFPARNRIIAGIVDAVIIVESKASGGSMITANFANEYNKDVFAIPGRVNDEYSKGCNKLIKEHKAFLMEDAADLIQIMRWEKKTRDQVQRSLFYDLTKEQQRIVDLIRIGVDDIDRLIQNTGMSPSLLSATLLDLEFSGVLKSLPGKKYICL